jgi:hypothetical protein
MSGHEGSSTRAILYAFFANLGIALAKTGAAAYTKSGSMLAEAIHSYADCGNQVLLYFGLKQSERPANVEHPMGYGKISYFWSFIVAILLFSLGGLFSIYEGVHKLQNPHELSKPWVGLVVLAFSIVLEIGSLAGALREINKLRGRRSMREWVDTTRNAELVVVLGEDLAAICGLVLAFVFLGPRNGDRQHDLRRRRIDLHRRRAHHRVRVRRDAHQVAHRGALGRAGNARGDRRGPLLGRQRRPRVQHAHAAVRAEGDARGEGADAPRNFDRAGGRRHQCTRAQAQGARSADRLVLRRAGRRGLKRRIV